MTQLVVIRFSSFGDIVQLLHALSLAKSNGIELQIHWITKEEFAPFLRQFSWIHRVWILPKSSSPRALFQLGRQVFAETQSLISKKPVSIFDAHNNLRSALLSAQFYSLHILNLLCHFRSWMQIRKNWSYFRRSKHRLRRIAYFKLGIPTFQFPVRGVDTFLAPLQKGLSRISKSDPRVPIQPQIQVSSNHGHDLARSKIVLAPSAAWELKRWPVEHWINLIRLLPNEVFVIVGGPKDDFCNEISASAPDRTINMAGKWSWVESTIAVTQAKAVISGDTGILHLSDFLGVPTLALLGPTAFGHPFSPTTLVVEKKLSCKPCTKDGRGKCKNKVFKTCLNDILPSLVVEQYAKLMKLPNQRSSLQR